MPFWSWRHLCARRPVRPHRQLGTALEAGGPTQLGLGTAPRAAAVPLRPRLQATLFWGLASPLPRLRRLRLTPQPRQLPGAAQHFLCLWPGHCLPCPEFLPAVSFHNNKNIRFCSAVWPELGRAPGVCGPGPVCLGGRGPVASRRPCSAPCGPGLFSLCLLLPASLCSDARVPRLPGTAAERRERTLRGWATRGPPGFCLICQLSPVVISGEPRSRSPEPASCLTTARRRCRQPVPCPVPCHLSR